VLVAEVQRKVGELDDEKTDSEPDPRIAALSNAQLIAAALGVELRSAG
jgi:hypothetical protein